MNTDDILTNFGDYNSEKYLDYSISVVSERALPLVHDGLKPVHRRILYAMFEMGIKAKDKEKKSARIVGDVIGKYHPHGDSAVYDTLVRLTQPWNMRYPLIKGQGNFGSRDKDPQAAMRYTESGIETFSESLLFKELKEDTVDFIPTYDGSFSEPCMFPARLHNLLLNGSQGIAVGMASKIPSHNIIDVKDTLCALIDNENLTIDEIMEYLKAPDFPVGCQIISSQDKINECYKKGQGTITVRAKYHIEKLEKGQWQLVITELPPDVSLVNILEEIQRILNPKPLPKDKKPTKEQLATYNKRLQEKQFLNSILLNQRDETDVDTPMRLVLSPRSSRQDKNEFINSLASLISIEKNYSMNFTMIGLDGRPECKNIKQILSEWIIFRRNVIKRRCSFYINKYKNRVHILYGRIIAFNNIDDFIHIIQNSLEPKEELMNKYNLTEIQAEDILDIKLRQLAKLEEDKLKKEKDSLEKEIDKLTKLISSEKRLNTLMKKEICEDSEQFKDERRTLIQEDESLSSNNKIDSVVEENISVILTNDGWLTQRKGHNYNINGFTTRLNDKIEKIIECKSTDTLAFLGSNGRSYSLKTMDIPNGKNDLHINSLIDIAPYKVVDCFLVSDVTKNDFYFFSNSNGYGFASKIVNLLAKNRAGKHFMTLPNNDNTVVFKPILITNELSMLNVIGYDPKKNDSRLLSFEIKEIKELDKGKGVQLMRLKDTDYLTSVSLSTREELKVKQNNEEKIFNKDEYEEFIHSRARRGKKIDNSISLN